jgi:acetyltransferase-like isoleucine patch superfamily enzyme
VRLLKRFWFYFVSLTTGWLPDIKAVMRMRGFLLRPSFKSCGRNFQVARGVTINFPHRLEIGRDVYIATGSWLHAWGGIVVEDEVQVGPYSVLVTGDHTLEAGSYRYGPSKLAPIHLCRGSWIAAHAVVTKGVRLGRGALLAASSVATTDIPDFAVAGGVPAKIIKEKSRFDLAM